MDDKKKVSLGVVTALLIFAAGRYTAPEKIKIETKIVEVEKKTEQNKKKSNEKTKKKTTKRKTTKPNGEVIEEIIKENETSQTDSTENKTSDEKRKSESTKKEQTAGGNRITVSALTGFDIKSGRPVYGASLTKSFIGPTVIGIWGLNNLSCGVTLGISF